VSEHAPYFTLGGYRALLGRARAAGYHVTPFRDFHLPSSGPVLLLRHDLDHSIRSAAAMAALEAEDGVRATYFVQVACEFYNLLSPESRRLLRGIAGAGHEIGLHYEAARYLEPRGAEHLRCDLMLLEDIVGDRVVSASQHIPIATGDRLDLSQFITNEAYEPRFTEPPMSYVSDSLMQWRQAHPHQLIGEGKPFQLLVHPMKWTARYTSMDDALEGALREEVSALEACTRDTAARYRRLLEERPRLDAAFRATRTAAPRVRPAGGG
jgi:hypothetical protein